MKYDVFVKTTFEFDIQVEAQSFGEAADKAEKLNTRGLLEQCLRRKLPAHVGFNSYSHHVFGVMKNEEEAD